MKTFEEWCKDKELKELSKKESTIAYQLWGKACFREGKEVEAKNADLRERLDKAEHRAEVAERACRIATDKIYDYSYEEAIAQAERELEEEEGR